jgi:hypothetical protein
MRWIECGCGWVAALDAAAAAAAAAAVAADFTREGALKSRNSNASSSSFSSEPLVGRAVLVQALGCASRAWVCGPVVMSFRTSTYSRSSHTCWRSGDAGGKLPGDGGALKRRRSERRTLPVISYLTGCAREVPIGVAENGVEKADLSGAIPLRGGELEHADHGQHARAHCNYGSSPLGFSYL